MCALHQVKHLGILMEGSLLAHPELRLIGPSLSQCSTPVAKCDEVWSRLI